MRTMWTPSWIGCGRSPHSKQVDLKALTCYWIDQSSTYLVPVTKRVSLPWSSCIADVRMAVFIYWKLGYRASQKSHR